MTDKLILRQVDGNGCVTFIKPKILSTLNPAGTYAYFEGDSERWDDCTGFIVVPIGYWSELIKDCDE